ncbi:hydrolase [Peptococcus simiae]|uniref:hydrolase n=1 Tax=Peptococcus simiae TaxID=1643805 RepID=UPI0039800B9C
MRLFPESTLAYAIDYQEKLLPVMREADRILARAKILTEGLNILQVPVAVTRQYPKGLGDTVADLHSALGDAPVYDKRSYSIYDADDLRQDLKNRAPKTILLYGIETHICVAQSAIDMTAAGYQVFLVVDACSSRYELDHKIGLKRMIHEGVGLTTVEAVLFELCRTSEHPHFKSISKLIK